MKVTSSVKNDSEAHPNDSQADAVLREWRDVTQAYLSFKTDIGQGYISDLENGRRKGTVAALSAIAKVLNVPLDILVTD